MIRKIFGSLAAFALIAGLFAVNPVAAEDPAYDTTGSYVINFEYNSENYAHDVNLTQAADGTLTGSGGSPAAANVYTWVIISGVVSGNDISFDADYTATADAVTPQTTMHVTGTIANDGSMSGTWTDNYQGGERAGTWMTASGTADPIESTTSTVVITGDSAAGENQPGWLFNRDPATDTPFEFNNDQHSIGSGSLYVMPISANGSDKFVGENFLNAPIANIDSISYDFMIGNGGTEADAEQFYMNVYANFGESDDLKFYDCRYDVIPTVGSTSGFTTVTFDPTQAYTVTTRSGASASPYTCPAIPADMDDLSANSNIRMFSINVGDTSANDEGLNGYLDNVVVDMGANTIIYDFEMEEVDEIAPAVPTHLSPANGDTVTQAELDKIDWTDVTDDSSPVVYYYQSSLSSATNEDGSFVTPAYTSEALTVSEISTTGTPEGTYYWHVRAVDNAGNTSAWSSAWSVTVDNDADEGPTPPEQPTNKDQCKNGGYVNLVDDSGDAFKNQGQCVSYVSKRK